MKKFDILVSPVVVLEGDDVDTDQIIPARFLRTTERTGLGAHLFSDWRFGADGQPNKDFVLNRKENLGRQILLAGRNFGCGSSREHAVWALADFGFRVVIAEGFADIFRKNALRNGLLTISIDEKTHKQCVKAAKEDTPFRIDLENTEVTAGPLSFAFEIDPFARVCLLGGVDELEYILGHEDAITAFEAARGTSR